MCIYPLVVNNNGFARPARVGVAMAIDSTMHACMHATTDKTRRASYSLANRGAGDGRRRGWAWRR